MKEHSFIVLMSIAVLSLSCSRMESEMDQKPGFPLEEAKASFEAAVSGPATRSGGVQPVRSRLSSGDITPWWEDAECVEGTGEITYTVPYEGEYRIYSYSGKYSEKPVRPWRRVGQELVLSKDLGSGSVEVLVKSTVKRLGLRQKAKFSGVVVFTDLVSGGVRAVRLYENDTLKESVEIDMSGGKEAMIESCRRAVKILKGYQFFRNRNIRTRSDDGEGDPDGDDGDEWEYPPTDGLIDWGNGLYEDPDTGAVYYDSDGDGEIDSMLIEPSVVTGGGDDGGGGGGGGGGSDPDDPDPEDPEDPEGPDDPDDPWNQTDTLSVLPPILPPANLSSLVGTEYFYIFRHQDYVRRTGRPAPDYYLNYGQKYYNKFQSAKQSMSQAGAAWVDLTAYLLQDRLNSLVVDNPQIEADSLSYYAFGMHCRAYLDAGFLSLSVLDRVTVVTTIELSDLLTEDGLHQVSQMIEAMLSNYVEHPDKAYDDAVDLIDNWEDVKDAINEYIDRYIFNGGVLPCSRQQVFDLIFEDLIDYYYSNIPGFDLDDYE